LPEGGGIKSRLPRDDLGEGRLGVFRGVFAKQLTVGLVLHLT
jgi:hypothetical protein